MLVGCGRLVAVAIASLLIPAPHAQNADVPQKHCTAHANSACVVPCVDNCLEEALSSDPTKGCPAGTVWEPYPSTDPKDSCRPCPMGFYCPATPFGECNYEGCNMPALKVNLNRKSACPIGTHLDFTGAQRLEQCKNCSHGFYQDWYGSPHCIPCPAGTYVDVNRTDAVRKCIPCLDGHYCPLGSPAPIPCPAGLYTRNYKMKALSNCLPCPRGHFCPLGSVHPTPCPGGKWANATGTKGTGEYPGTYKMVGNITGDSCRACPASFFCPIGSVVPTSCPGGTFSIAMRQKESDCLACPVGSTCSLPSNKYTAQSLVVRDANNEQIVGSVRPVLCAVDTWNWHYSYFNLTGCVENCPYKHTHQSYCHVAGDGRVPDRDALELRIAAWITKRAAFGRSTKAERAAALSALDMELTALPNTEKLQVLTMPDENARTPLIRAAMLGDLAGMKVLWKHGAGKKQHAIAARDAGGFTALMHILAASVVMQASSQKASLAWLTTKMPLGPGATLAPGDVQVLVDRGVNVTGVPMLPMQVPPAYVGRGSLTWTHPSSANFTVAPYDSNTDPKYSHYYGGSLR